MSKKKLMPNAPTKPMSGYFKFCAAQRKLFGDELKSVSVGDQAKKFSSLWAEVDEKEKEKYAEEYNADMKVYHEKFNEYKKTDEYKNAIKNRKKKKVKRRPSAYNLFMKEEFERMKENNQETKLDGAIKDISGKWKELTEEAKTKYKKMAEDWVEEE